MKYDDAEALLRLNYKYGRMMVMATPDWDNYLYCDRDEIHLAFKTPETIPDSDKWQIITLSKYHEPRIKGYFDNVTLKPKQEEPKQERQDQQERKALPLSAAIAMLKEAKDKGETLFMTRANNRHDAYCITGSYVCAVPAPRPTPYLTAFVDDLLADWEVLTPDEFYGEQQ